jgi:cytochrome P450
MFGFDFSEEEIFYIRKAINQIFRLETRYLQVGGLATSRFSPLSIGYRQSTAKTRALFDDKIEKVSRCPFSKNYINDFQAREINNRNPLIDIGRKKLIDDVQGLTIAGLDTVNLTINWAVRILLQRPDVVQKIRTEADAVLLKHGVSTQAYDNLPYTKGVVLEALRLYPPFPLLIVKQTVEEMAIGSGIIPAKSWLCILAYSIHRDARWFEKPELFIPERWSDQQVERYRSTFLAFGTGTHRCLGWDLGLMEATLIVAMLWHRFNLESAIRLKPYTDDRIPYNLKVLLHIKGGLPLKLTTRT